MSEHQVYEYLAIDEPLSEAQQRQLRKVSTRAEITSTRFWNEYHWGDLKADPRKLLAQYFDLHFYSANWGERVLMMRFPAKGLDHRKLKPYFSGEGATLSKMGRFLVAEFWAEANGPTDDSDAELSDFVPLRAQLFDGDRRAAYLGWLAGIDRDANDGDLEPEVPPGLRKLDAPLKALAALLGLDASLLKAASEQSPELHFDLEAATAWLHQQPPAEKERLLLRAMKDPSVRVGHHLRAAFLASTALPRQRRRSVAELRARATELA